MAVGADHRAVQTEIPGLEGRNGAQLGGKEVLLPDAVFFKQQPGNGDLDLFLAGILPQAGAADEEVELFSLDALAHGLAHLVGRQVGQQVGDAEHRIAGLFADGDAEAGAIPADDDAVQRQRDGRPLVFFDAAVVVRFEEALLGFLKERPGFEVQTGAVDMRHPDAYPLRHAAAAHRAGNERLAAVVEVDLIPRLVLLGVVKGGVARLFQHGNGGGDRLTLGLGGIQEVLVALAEIAGRFQLLGGKGFGHIFGFQQQFLAELLALGFFAHGYGLLSGDMVILQP